MAMPVVLRVADDPSGDFHFHRGAAYAATILDYDTAELAKLPPETTASFAGVGNPFIAGNPAPGRPWSISARGRSEGIRRDIDLWTG
jgi:hypothetical protein